MDAISTYFQSTCFSIVAIVFIVLITILYIRKGYTNKSKSRSIFIWMIIISFWACILNFIFPVIITNFGEYSLITNIITRMYFLDLLFFPFLFCTYMISYIDNKVKNKHTKLFYSFLGTLFLVIVILDFICGYKVINNEIISYRGMLNNIFTLENIVVSGIIVILSIRNYKVLTNVNLTPPIVIYILYIILIVVEMVTGYYSNFVPLFCVVIVACLYFTTESQDAIMIENYNNSVIQRNNSINSKTNYLYNISSELRHIMNNESGNVEILKNIDSKDLKEVKDYILKIKKSNAKTSILLNSIYDINEIKNNKIVVSNSNYNIREFMDILNLEVMDILDNNIVFNTNVYNNVPSTLNSDTYLIKKILLNVIVNASTFIIDEGSITLNVSCENALDEVNVKYNISVKGKLSNNNSFNEEYLNSLNNGIIDNIDGIRIGFNTTKDLIKLLDGDIKYNRFNDDNDEYDITIKELIVRNYSQVGDENA